MAINSRAINSQAINSSSFVQPDTEIASVSFEQAVFTLETASVSFEQAVFTVESASVDFEQIVSFLQVETASITFEQSVFTLEIFSLALQQRVRLPVVAQDAIKWEAIVLVDSVHQTLLTGAVTVSGGEGEQILASFQIKPEAGVIAVSDWTAKPVTIDYADQTTFARLFTGIVDEVEYDATENLLTFTCITNRKDLINAKTRDELTEEIGGFWSKFVFDEDADPFEYANDRVSTVLAAYETNPFNQFKLVPFAAKSTEDIAYDEDEILDGTVVPTFVSRDQLVNNWVLEFEYRYDRLRHRERTYTWDMLTKTLSEGVFAGFNSWSEYLRNPVTLMPRDAVETAIESNSWVVKDVPTFTDLPPAGYFDGWGWSPKQSTIFTDEQGRQIRQFKDVSAVFTTSADFTLANRFAQQITESYAVTMAAPQSIAQYGSIDDTTARGIRVDFDISSWEDFTAYKTPTGSVSANGDWVIDQDGDSLEGGRASFDNAVLAAQSIIKREMLDAHRQNYAEFDVFLDPRVDLTKTIHVNTARVQAKGKVYEFEHTMIIDGEEPIATTSVKLAISKATGSQSDDTIAVPTPPTVTDAAFTPPVKTLGTHFGNHYNSPAYQDWWSGCITNYQFQDFISASLNQYPAKFTVDSEKIGDEDRKERIVPAPSTVNVEIPDELLTITAP